MAEREKRAQEKHAEADRIVKQNARQMQINTKKEREAEAIRITADAKTYELSNIAGVLKKQGPQVGNYDIMSKQVQAMGELASSESTKSIIMPTDVTAALGSVQALMDLLGKSKATKS